ncbi:MAG: hypothetical protein PHX27_01460 [Candidatus ainarchaeum sp.]|nr:hypothetical protein [Candidatus ainarchaeum sp.]
MKQVKIILILIILIFFFFGCTEMSREEKNLCYSLTTQSYDYITNCKTENTCFEEINLMISTNLGYEQESKLYELKNNFGRSWFYYNKGVEELKKISKLCNDGNNPELPGTINQTRFYLEQAFRELDFGINNSFEVITLQEQMLTEQKIDLLKEEEIYFSLIELRQILSDLENNNTTNNNYVGYYLEKIKNYNASNASKKYEYLIERNSFWIKSYKIVEGSILTQLGLEREGQFPFLSNYFYDLFNTLENVFFKYESIDELKNLPAKEFMKLYSDLAGSKNSSIKRFADLINKIDKDYAKIKKDLPKYWETLEKTEIITTNLLNEINNTKQFTFLEQELLLQGINKQIDYEKIIEDTRKEIFELKNRKAKNNIGLGEELQKIKQITNILQEININLEIKKQKNIVLLKEKCFEQAQKITKEKFETEKKELILIKQDLSFFTTNVIKKNNDMLYYCEEMLKTKQILIDGINDYEKLELKKLDLTKNCFEYLNKIINYSNEFELIILFENLKNEEVTPENIFYFNDACESIKNQLHYTLEDDYFIKNIVENIKKINELTVELKQINYYLNEKNIQKEIDVLEKRIQELNIYFSNNTIHYDKILFKKEKLFEELKNEIQTLTEKNNKYKKIAIEKTIKKEYINYNLTQVGIDNNIILKITINNPFETITTNETYFIKIDEGKLIEIPTNFENICFGETGFISLTNTPNGLTEILIQINKNIEISQTDKIIYATTQAGLIQRKIIANTEKINKLLIKTNIPSNQTNIIVFINQKEITNIIQNNEIIFVAENVDNKTEILVFIYTKELIKLEKILKNEKLLTKNNQKLEYTIITKNLTNEKISGTIIIPLNSNEKIKQINIFDEEMINKQKEILNGNLVLKNQAFLPGQERKYLLIIDIDSVEDYYIEQLKQILLKLNQHNETIISKEIEKILLIEFNEKLIKEYEILIKTGNEKIIELENEFKKMIDEQLKIQTIKQKILLLEEQLIESTKLGLEKTTIEIEKLIQQANNELQLNQFDQAMLTIEKKVFKIDVEILNKIKEIKKEINTEKNNKNEELQTIINEIIKNINYIEENIAYYPVESKKAYLEINNLFEQYNKKLILIKTNDEIKVEEKQTEFNLILTQTKLLIIFLEKELDNFEKTNTLRIIFPITKSRLEKIKETIMQYEEFNEKDFIQLQNINDELTKSITELKRNVIKEYNFSIDNNVNYSTLEKAKTELDLNNYIQALILLKTDFNQDNLILGIIPIILIIFVAGVLKISISKKKQKDENLKKQVLEQWDE